MSPTVDSAQGVVQALAQAKGKGLGKGKVGSGKGVRPQATGGSDVSIRLVNAGGTLLEERRVPGGMTVGQLREALSSQLSVPVRKLKLHLRGAEGRKECANDAAQIAQVAATQRFAVGEKLMLTRGMLFNPNTGKFKYADEVVDESDFPVKIPMKTCGEVRSFNDGVVQVKFPQSLMVFSFDCKNKHQDQHLARTIGLRFCTIEMEDARATEVSSSAAALVSAEMAKVEASATALVGGEMAKILQEKDAKIFLLARENRKKDREIQELRLMLQEARREKEATNEDARLAEEVAVVQPGAEEPAEEGAPPAEAVEESPGGPAPAPAAPEQ